MARRELAVAALAFAALTAFWFRPLLGRLGSAVVPDPGDPWFCLAVLDWDYRSLGRGLVGVWSPPFFHPTPGALALSDHLIGPAVLTAPLRALAGDETIAYNLLVLVSFALGGFFTWLLCRRRGMSAPAAAVAGLVYAAAPFRWDQISHLPILLAQWVPLVLWAWDHLLTAPSGRRAAAFLLVYALHVTGGTSLAYMIHLPLAVLLAVHLRSRWRQLVAPPSLRVVGTTLAGAGALAAAVFLPYLVIGHRLGLGRSAAETRGFGAVLSSLVVPSTWNLYFRDGLWDGLRRGEDALFPGLVATLLVSAAMVLGRARNPRPSTAGRFVAAAGVGVMLLGLAVADRVTLAGDAEPAAWLGLRPTYGLGRLLLLAGVALLVAQRRLARRTVSSTAGREVPHTASVVAAAAGEVPGSAAEPRDPDLLRWERALAWSGLLALLLCFPLVYLPASRIVPGLDGMRVPSRFFAMALLPLAWFAGRGLDRLRALAGPRFGGALAALALAVLFVESTPRRFPTAIVPLSGPTPAVYAWLAAEPAVDGILELPISERTSDEIPRMLWQTVHRKPLANGFSGYLTPIYRTLKREMIWPLDTHDQFERLREYRISHLVAGPGAGDVPAPDGAPRRLDDALVTGPGAEAELVYADRSHLVYRVLPGVGEQPAVAALAPSTPAEQGERR